jgi:hypothetical protein
VTWTQFTPDQSGSGSVSAGSYGGGEFTAAYRIPGVPPDVWIFTPLGNAC